MRIRMARRVVRDRGAVLKLFDEIAPRFLGRQGGYTRIIKLPQRPGDAAPMSMLELMPEDGGAPKRPAGRQGQGPTGQEPPTGKAAKAEAKGAEKAPPRRPPRSRSPRRKAREGSG